jgi:tetratricopeptide (TPR) repeat protein
MTAKNLLTFVLILVLSIGCKPQNEELHNAAKKSLQEKKWPEALKYLNQAIDQIPTDAIALNLRGICKLEQGKFEDAASDFTTAIGVEADNYKYHYNRGNAYLEMSDYNAALADYNAALALNTNEIDLYINRGNLFYRMQQYSQASEDFYFSIMLDSTNAPAHYNLAKTSFMLNDFEPAVKELKNAIQLEPKYTDAYFWLGLALLQIDQPEEGCLTLQTAQRMGHKDARDAIAANCGSGGQQ